MLPEFLESEIELFVQRILMHEFYTSSSEYHIIKVSPGSEKSLGYDAKIVGLTPFYCQFKTSSYLSSGKRFKKREAFCVDKKWPLRPAYAFGLRPPSDKALSSKPAAWQHNILHSLWKSSPHAVAYVAPTFHTRLGMQAFEPRPTHHHCFCAHYHSAHRSHIDINWVSVNDYVRARLPAFQGLVSIPPHVPVKSLSHTYFYTSHMDVTLHSEASEVKGSMQFGDYIVNNVRRALDVDRRPIVQEIISVDRITTMTGLDQDDVIRVLNYGSSLLEKISEEPGDFDNLTPLNQQRALAYGLEAFFGISTFVIAEIEKEI
jgi:hypothetical protein